MITIEHEGSVVAVNMVPGKLRAIDDTRPYAGCSPADGELRSTPSSVRHMPRFVLTTGEVLDRRAPSGITTWSVVVADETLVLSAPQGLERYGNALAALRIVIPGGAVTGHFSASRDRVRM
jgi:nitrite reductase/ring-hydroxylating ferredoxin subunit